MEEPQELKRKIGVFHHILLPITETFILEQVKYFSKWEAHFFGRERGNGDFEIPNLHLLNPQGDERLWRKFIYTLTGKSQALLRHMQRVQPELLHAHFGVEGTYALPFAKRLNIPLITSFYGFDASQTAASLLWSRKISHVNYLLQRRQLSQKGDCFLANSRFIQKCLLDLGFPEERILLHYMGIDLSLFQTASAVSPFHILTAGRLVEKKGIDYLIRAIVLIKDQFPKVRLEIIGDGPLRSTLTQLVEHLQLQGYVRFLGSLSYQEYAKKLRQAAVFCLPSVTAKNGDSEGLPTVFMEASATSLPVIGTYHSGIPEVIENEKTGFLVPERDVDALASKLRTLLENPTLCLQMGKAGRQKMERDFNSAYQAQKLESLYEQVIDSYHSQSSGSSSS
ncbi:glycosyltransferase [Deltaproteobacteria bacterium TL4]